MLETVRTFTALSEEFVEESLRRWPVRATAAGIHDYDHLLPDDTPAGFRERSVWLRDLEQRLAASVIWEELPTEQRVDYALLRSNIVLERAGLEEIRAHARDPVALLRTALDGVHLLVARPFAPFEDRKEAIVARLIAMPEYLAAGRAGLEPAPAVWVKLALEVADGAPGFVHEVVRALLRAFPGDSERIEHAGARANAGLAAFRDALERDLAPQASGDFAAGARWVDFRLEREHLLPLGHQALERLGREHVARLRELLEREAGRLDSARPWSAIEDALRAGSRPRAAALEAELERARRFVIERRLAPVPETPLAVIETPAWLRPLVGPIGYLPPGPFDIEPAGVLMWPGAEAGRRGAGAQLAGGGLALAAARAGWPGRHLQCAHAIRSGSRLRRLAADRLLADGWAAYAEEWMVEEGFSDEPAQRLGVLLDLLGDAARAVVDVGLHTGGMDLDRAADYLSGQALLEAGEALAEVKRITREPARAQGAFAGRLQLIELREEAKRRMDERFDRLDFHAALLASGALPPALIREELWDRLGVG